MNARTSAELEARVEHLEELLGSLDEATNARLEALEDQDGTLAELRGKLTAASEEIARLKLAAGGSPAAKLRTELAAVTAALRNESAALAAWIADAAALGWEGEEAFVDWVRARIKRPRGRPRGSSTKAKAKPARAAWRNGTRSR